MPAGCSTYNNPSKLGQGSDTARGEAAQAWLGHGFCCSAEQVEEEEGAALAEQQYFEQLHAIALEQAALHNQLRNSFVLKAYKGMCGARCAVYVGCVLRQASTTVP